MLLKTILTLLAGGYLGAQTLTTYPPTGVGGGLLPYTGTGSPSGQTCVGQPNAVTYGTTTYVCNGTVYAANTAASPTQAANTITANPGSTTASPSAVPVNTCFGSVSSGGNEGAQIASCLTKFSSTGAYLDFTGLPAGGTIPLSTFSGITQSFLIRLGTGTHVLTGTSTIPSNITLDVIKGGLIDTSSGSVATINAALLWPTNQQVFANPLTGGAGSVILAQQPMALQWFGGDPLVTTDYTQALKNAAAATPAVGGAIHATTGKYTLTSLVFIDQKVNVFGDGANHTQFNCTTTGITCLGMASAATAPANPPHGGFEHIGFIGPTTSSSDANNCLYIGGDPTNVVSPSTYYGYDTVLSDDTFANCTHAITLGSNAFIQQWDKLVVNYNYIGIYAPTGDSNSGEMLALNNSSLSNNAYGTYSLGNSNWEFRYTGVSSDYNTSNAFFDGTGPLDLTCTGCHWEGVTLAPFISTTYAARLTLVGNNFLNDSTSGTLGSFIKIGNPSLGSRINIIGGFGAIGSGGTVTTMLEMDGTLGNSRINFEGYQVSPSGSYTLTNDTASVTDLEGISIKTPLLLNNVNTVASSATPAFNLALGNYQYNTLTANVTAWTVSNISQGGRWCFAFLQGGSGGYTVASGTAPASVHGFGGVPSGQAVGKYSTFCFFSPDGSTLLNENGLNQ